jgi:hypothetical protein
MKQNQKNVQKQANENNQLANNEQQCQQQQIEYTLPP